MVDQLRREVAAALAAAGVDIQPEDVELERPARREHGDFSTNAALVFAKHAREKPRAFAERVAQTLAERRLPFVRRVEVAGPGFVNFHLDDSWLHEVLREVVRLGDQYARHDFGAGARVCLEFVSANPTGPLHAGHGRGAAYGDSLARIFERCGYRVHRENYLNDRGVQTRAFAESLAAAKAGREIPEDGYHGEYVKRWAAEMPEGSDPLEWGLERAVRDHRETLEQMNVHFDEWFSERSLVSSGAIEKTLEELRSRGVVYEKDGAVWLRSTAHGDDKDRVLVKSDGEYTYLLPDIAYHKNKIERGFDLLVDVWGADHHGYVPRMRAALRSLGVDDSILECRITQMVNLLSGGRPVRLSKRAGDVVELRDVLDAVGPDAARLTYLLQSVDAPLDFDLEVVKSRAMENPVYYVQMAHARICSVSRVASERGVARAPLESVDLSLLVHESELDVLRSLSELPEVVAVACRDRAPHKVTNWVRDLAGRFHRFYHDCRVLPAPGVEDVPEGLTQARLWLTEAAAIGLRIGLDLLGVSAPDRM
ncbi:MAG: arginine--tRNA ligase [Acidimicrobiales bacterium]|nr:MAG: arginine--tRNA ligase [Acidimicrobiales bacterium]